MSAKPIQKAWQSYERLVLPSNAPEIQRRETRQAFYAGAAVLFEALMRGLDKEKEPTEADMQRMNDVVKELREFGQQLDGRYVNRGH